MAQFIVDKNNIVKLFSYDDYDDGNRTHFLATVVCCSKKRKEKHGTELFEIFDIVDGQQRITTLIILMKAIHKKLESIGDVRFRKDINKLDELLVKDSDSRLILIQTNHDSSLVLRNYLVSGKIVDKKNIQTQAEHNLYYAFLDNEQSLLLFAKDMLRQK
ncbi:GmrSD restriction endonuclease domain-containing protein [Schinkia sp. CFF1]